MKSSRVNLCPAARWRAAELAIGERARERKHDPGDALAACTKSVQLAACRIGIPGAIKLRRSLSQNF